MTVTRDDPLDDIERLLFRVARTVYSLKLASHAVGNQVDRADVVLLSRLAERDGVRLSELAADLGLDVSTVSRQVRSTEAEGLVVRTPDPDDGRACRLAITPRGREAVGRVRAARRALLERALDHWSAADRHTLAVLLDRLYDDLGALSQCPAPAPDISAGPTSPRLERSPS